MKPVEWSPHAIHMMTERAIEADWIERVIAAPERISPDATDSARQCAFGRIDEFGGRWLRVVYFETAAAVRVITAFFDRGVEKQR